MPEVYDMFMKLGLTGGALTGLLAISDRLTRIHRLSEDINTSFSRWHVALGGFASILAGGAILGGLEKMIDKTKAYSDELVKIKRLGGEMAAFADSGELASKAFDISRRVPMKVEDLMKIPGMAYSILGKDEAVTAWESLARYSFLQQSDEGFKRDPSKALGDVLRAGELTGRITDPITGAIDMQKFDRFLDMMAKIKAATHGMVNEQTMLGLAKQGGFTLRGLTDEGFMAEAIMAQAMGGPRAGTGTLSLMQQFAGGTMRKRTAVGMEELGLLNSNEWTTDKGGGVVLSDEASKRLTRLISKDPFELAAKLRDEFEKQGVTDPEERMRKVLRAFGRQTTQRFTAEEVNNFEQMMRERERMMGGMGAGQGFDATMAGSVSANLEAVKTAWENLQTAIAGPNSQNIISFLKQFTSVINSMQTGLRGIDPDVLASIGKGLAYLGVGLVGAGAAAILLALSPVGWLVGGLTALIAVFANDEKAIHGMQQFTSAITGLVASEWEHVAKGFETIKTAISDFITWLESIGASIKHFLDLSRFLPSQLKKDSNFEGNGPNGAAKIPANFSPGERKQVLQPVQMNLNIDGRTLAKL
jgi:hypothetical protein